MDKEVFGFCHIGYHALNCLFSQGAFRALKSEDIRHGDGATRSLGVLAHNRLCWRSGVRLILTSQRISRKNQVQS